MNGNRTEEARDLAEALLRIRRDMQRYEAQFQHLLPAPDTGFKESALNLLHYLALRQQDLRPIQPRLTALGLSSLGRAESNVMHTVDSVLETLCHLAGQPGPAHGNRENGKDTASSPLDEHTRQLLGPQPGGRTVRIMVTMPSEAASNYQLVHDLLAAGMDCMRINCAHDDATAWARMISHLEQARRALNRPCRVQLDLGGPKLRTCDIHQRLTVLRLKPRRDTSGQVTEPARLLLVSDATPLPSGVACGRVEPTWLNGLVVDDTIRLTDARGARRKWRVSQVSEGYAEIEASKTAYLRPGTLLYLDRSGKPTTPIIELPVRDGTVRLWRDDELVITRTPAVAGTNRSVGCTLPQVFDDVKVGEPILFDDGRIAGVIKDIRADQVTVTITRAQPDGSNLGVDKGINLPESHVNLPAITDRDRVDLLFAAEHADIIGLSFTNTPEDVIALHDQIAAAGDNRPGIVLKIETRRGFENLPAILLAAMRSPGCGVMIARGDLAVECGFVRLAEVQEEILWLCEAAHVPVIWATQVLESLAKDGMPSRAEITDAAMADRAECVMLNKGPHITHAVTMLDDILTRMQSHQSKKRAMLRELHIAHRLDS
ncbi:MAG: pyruvate kinase [Pseudomonadota bacterium]